MATPKKDPSQHKPKSIKGRKKASFSKAAEELEEKVTASATYRNDGIHKYAASALDVLTGIHAEKREDALKGVREREPEHKIDPDTGLLVDEFGVPFIEGNKVRTKKNHNRKRTPEQRQLIAKRIQDARGLLTLFYSTEDATRMLSAAWGIAPKSCFKYLVIARKQNKAILNREGTEWKSDSLMFWTQKLHETHARKQKALKELAEVSESLKEVSKHIKTTLVEDADGFKLKQLKEIQGNYVRQADHLRRTIHACDFQTESYGDRIDKLVGNYAPERIALTDAAGNDIVEAREPITVEERNQQLSEAIKNLNPAVLSALGLKRVETLEASPSETAGPAEPVHELFPIEVDSDDNYDEDDSI